MPKKSRVLYIKKYLEEQTDENHPASMTDILAYLEAEGIVASRKTVAPDIEQLIESGVDVVENTGKRYEYFIGDRHFELPELKLLVDAVQASRFIPAKKSAALIEKLTALTSIHKADELSRRLYTTERIKPTNEKVYIIVDLLHAAINTGKQVTFKYYDYSRNKRKLYKHNGRIYRVSPYGLIWNSDRYYIVGWSESHNDIARFRVDRIAVPEITVTPAVPKPEYFDMASYANSVFQMYEGEVRSVALLCDNDLMNSIIDRFGEDVKTELVDSEHFTAYADVSASPTFYGWVTSFGGRMLIIAPENVRKEYSSLINSLACNA
ncbi:MAG: WYL domain-containing protein [Oscillospiraceae bacterium]|jgi:predicted DNA-binding transcriptional regulator YafY|nr:WYL domain-containing protein [Oscillospiraceae bacterium]